MKADGNGAFLPIITSFMHCGLGLAWHSDEKSQPKSKDTFIGLFGHIGHFGHPPWENVQLAVLMSLR